MYRFLFCVLIFCLASPAPAQELVKLRPYARQLLFTGFTRPVKEMTISSEVNGKCIEVTVDKGDIIKNPEVAQIDATFVRLDLQKNNIARQQTQRRLELEEKTLKRYTSLMKKNSTAQATFDEAEQKAEILRLDLKNLETEKSRLQELLERHTLTAPIGWRVIRRFVEPGEYIRQGEPVVKLGDFSKLIIPFSLSYEELELLKTMTDIRLVFLDVDRTIEARIYRVAPDFNEQQKKIDVELTTMAPPPDIRRGGLRVRLAIAGKQEKSTFLVPFSALLSGYEANWLIMEDGRKKKVILLGQDTTGEHAIVTGDGLTAGERVMASPFRSGSAELPTAQGTP